MTCDLGTQDSAESVRGKYKCYPAYKDSGIAWVGELPAHWEVKRLKHLLVEPLKYGANEPADHTEYNLPRYIRITDIREDGTLRGDSFRSIPEDIAKPYLLVGGDILFARSGATVGKTFRYHPSWGKAAYAGYLIRARLDNIKAESNFVEYFTRSQGYANWLQNNFIQATIQNVSAERYASLSISIPPLLEQRAIAAFLDRETARIDALVAKKERLIELLQEKRTALISHAVTKGLDPDALMKDSAIEWLGEIPAHWEVRRFKTLGSNFANGTTAEQLQYGVSDFPVSRIETISTGKIDYAKVGYLSEFGVIESFILKPDDFLISHINSYERVGNSARYKGNRTLIHGMNLIRVTPLNIIAPGYLEFLLKSSLFTEGMKRACKPAINQVSVPTTAVKAIQFALPPLPEQRAIAEFLDRETARIDALVTKVREVIDRHKELRSALISAAVTGKIDVREVTA